METPDFDSEPYNSDKPLIALFHGSWMDDTCFDDLRGDLEAKGYPTVAPRLPTEEPTGTFDVCGMAGADAIQLEQETHDLYFNPVVAVFSSRAGNYAPWLAQRTRVDHIIFVNATFEENTLVDLPYQAVKQWAPERNPNQAFCDGIIELDEEMIGGRKIMTRYNPDIAEQVFFHKLPLNRRKERASELRKQRRDPLSEPVLEVWPRGLSMESLISMNDRVVNPDWSMWMAAHVLKIEASYMRDSGHLPFEEDPVHFSDRLIERIERQQKLAELAIEPVISYQGN